MTTPRMAYVLSKLQRVDTFDEFAQFWNEHACDFDGHTILFSFSDTGADTSFAASGEHTLCVKWDIHGIFSRPKLYLMNGSVWDAMQRTGRYDAAIRIVIFLDTQFGRYAEKYLEDPKFREEPLGKSVVALMRHIARTDIPIDYSFYIMENYVNYLFGERVRIRKNIESLISIGHATVDSESNEGVLSLPFDQAELERRVNGVMDLFENPKLKSQFQQWEFDQTRIVALLSKAVLLKHSALMPIEKVRALLEFSHRDMACILLRELVVCARWLLGKSISHFDPVNVGPGYAFVPAKLHGMAWDYMLMRHAEQCSSVMHDGVPTMAYFASCDQRLNDVVDELRFKGCVYPPPDGDQRYMMISDESADVWLASVVGPEVMDDYFSYDAYAFRRNHQPHREDMYILRRHLEYAVVRVMGEKLKSQKA